jgi:uncharacterized membrane protein YeaQ/YmgE (transglycosylase-associated protein family)
MSILAFILVGLFSGFLAGKIVEGHGFGTLGDIVVGIVGAFVGGFVFTNSGIHDGSLIGAVVTSTLGAIIFLVVAGLFSRSIHHQKA